MLFGKRHRSKLLNCGKFYCPECRCTAEYTLKQKQLVYSIVWLPVFPLGDVGRYVECTICRNSFRENVLDSTPETSRAEFHPSMKRIMILMMMADGDISDSEISSIQQIYTRVSGNSISREEIIEEIEAAEKENYRVHDYLRTVTPYLNNVGKALVLKSAYYVAAADGVFQSEEEELMEELSCALEMEPSQFKHVISSLKNEDDSEFSQQS